MSVVTSAIDGCNRVKVVYIVPGVNRIAPPTALGSVRFHTFVSLRESR